jgi:RNA polymerase sigma-70 factor, ECF subfamily
LSDRQADLLELLDHYGAGLYALLARLTLREDVAQELMQELFLKLHGTKDQGRIECWYAYARRVAINLAFDWRRRQSVRRTCSLDALSERASETDSPLGQLIASEELEHILAAVGRLHGASREVFVLRHLQQCSYEEIAEQLGKTVHQVRALCFRALSILRDALGCEPEPADGKEVQHVTDE